MNLIDSQVILDDSQIIFKWFPNNSRQFLVILKWFLLILRFFMVVLRRFFGNSQWFYVTLSKMILEWIFGNSKWFSSHTEMILEEISLICKPFWHDFWVNLGESQWFTNHFDMILEWISTNLCDSQTILKWFSTEFWCILANQCESLEHPHDSS